MSEKKRVGCVIIVNVGSTPHVLLQRRGMWNFEKSKTESYRNAFQISAVGRIEESDASHEAALARELHEELGLQRAFLPAVHKGWYGDLYCEVYHLNLEQLASIRLHASSGGVSMFLQGYFEKYSRVLTREQKDLGVQTFDTVTMFEDEIEVVKMAFKYKYQ
jgi:8-oxo-dGTP pyrophosphatase MutT (NUDIX family)